MGDSGGFAEDDEAPEKGHTPAEELEAPDTGQIESDEVLSGSVTALDAGAMLMEAPGRAV